MHDATGDANDVIGHRTGLKITPRVTHLFERVGYAHLNWIRLTPLAKNAVTLGASHPHLFREFVFVTGGYILFKIALAHLLRLSSLGIAFVLRPYPGGTCPGSEFNCTMRFDSSTNTTWGSRLRASASDICP